MRHIFIDEAGTSAGEPVTVVAGVIIRSDCHWRQLDEYLLTIIKRHIPEQYQDGFVFHAKDISAGNGIFSDRNLWPPKRRWDIIKDVLRANREIGYDIVLGIVRKDKETKLTPAQEAHIRHLSAFAHCLTGVELFLKNLASDEIATVVIEDIPERRKHLKEVQQDMLNPSDNAPWDRNAVPLRHIVQTPLFAEKADSRHLQYADACSFAMRGYCAGFKGFDQLVSEMLVSGSVQIMPQDKDFGHFLITTVDLRTGQIAARG
ncbi:DUF3800 domain-containing protein [Thalassobaculum sp. OXR-137]|uniref:DUF3800 domain-containing protein n=1 Tax=Thalassobaculum sp. OXR-137 TaxID=3100173 RepID=UPI002AC8BC8F|nr:DUF3800 domain-containing protein [Thalassobaculum sp. OXR-137]WPZ35404.1 DUF3800 domain-containing protein [Thalassobaculum sp. OXR-137]